MPPTSPRGAEQVFERALFATRWLLAPMYLGLVIALAMLVVIFLRDLATYAPKLITMKSDDAILVALTLIDLALAANLVLIVTFSGYENFVSKFDFDSSVERPEWMGKVDFGGLKMKLIASMVAISGIHLLKRFMEIRDLEHATAFGENELKWLVIIHLTFVFSGVILAAMDWLQSKSYVTKK